MASGTLGQSSLAATTNTTVYTVPAGNTATFSVNMCNRDAFPVQVRLAICATSTPANSEFLEFDTVIAAHGVLERTGIVASAGKLVVAYANVATVSVNVYGFEE